MNEIIVEKNEVIEQTEPVIKPTKETNEQTEVTEPTIETTEPNKQQEQPIEQPNKKKRGRPKKNIENKENDVFDFFNDLENQKKLELETLDDKPTSEINTSESPSPPIKETLLFLDGLICNALKHFLKKNIEPMGESEAEFIASLAPQDLDLLKPSKTTFFVVLGGYYLMKLL